MHLKYTDPSGDPFSLPTGFSGAGRVERMVMIRYHFSGLKDMIYSGDIKSAAG
jgi:hypothetical protein